MFMSDHEYLMDEILNSDVEIIETVRQLIQEDWDSETLKQQIADLLKIRDDMVAKLMTAENNHVGCDCGHSHE